MESEQSQQWTLDHCLTNDQLVFEFSGDWQIENNPPDVERLSQIVSQHPCEQITLNGAKLTHYDSSFIANLLTLYRHADKKGVRIVQESIPESVSKPTP